MTLSQPETRRQAPSSGGSQRERGDAAGNGSMCERDHAGLVWRGVEPTQSSLTLNNAVGVSASTDGGDEGGVEEVGMRYTEGRALNSCLGSVKYRPRDPGRKGDNPEENALPAQLCGKGPDPTPAAPDNTNSWLCKSQIIYK